MTVKQVPNVGQFSTLNCNKGIKKIESDYECNNCYGTCHKRGHRSSLFIHNCPALSGADPGILNQKLYEDDNTEHGSGAKTFATHVTANHGLQAKIIKSAKHCWKQVIISQLTITYLWNNCHIFFYILDWSVDMLCQLVHCTYWEWFWPKSASIGNLGCGTAVFRPQLPTFRLLR